MWLVWAVPVNSTLEKSPAERHPLEWAAMPNDSASPLTGLAPVIAPNTRILILGSFPGAASLAAQQYYAHPQNHFWRILAAVLEQPLADMDYAARTVAVKQAGIAIWDIYGACQREGSLDSAIRAAAANDVVGLKRRAPQLRRVCFNGQLAGKFAPTMQAAGYEAFILPSTSPANARQGFQDKLALWRAALTL